MSNNGVSLAICHTIKAIDTSDEVGATIYAIIIGIILPDKHTNKKTNWGINKHKLWWNNKNGELQYFPYAKFSNDTIIVPNTDIHNFQI